MLAETRTVGGDVYAGIRERGLGRPAAAPGGAAPGHALCRVRAGRRDPARAPRAAVPARDVGHQPGRAGPDGRAQPAGAGRRAAHPRGADPAGPRAGGAAAGARPAGRAHAVRRHRGGAERRGGRPRRVRSRLAGRTGCGSCRRGPNGSRCSTTSWPPGPSSRWRRRPSWGRRGGGCAAPTGRCASRTWRARSAGAAVTSASGSARSWAWRRSRRRGCCGSSEPAGCCGAGTLDLASLAVECGFYDQAHLTNEWRALAGCTPGTWIAEELPFLQDEQVGAGQDSPV